MKTHLYAVFEMKSRIINPDTATQKLTKIEERKMESRTKFVVFIIFT